MRLRHTGPSTSAPNWFRLNGGIPAALCASKKFRASERAVAHELEQRAVELVSAGFRHRADDPAGRLRPMEAL